jgi:hypothetical protein
MGRLLLAELAAGKSQATCDAGLHALLCPLLRWKGQAKIALGRQLVMCASVVSKLVGCPHLHHDSSWESRKYVPQLHTFA